MKKLVKGALLVAVGAFVMTSCNKEKSAVKKLEGTWTLSSSSTDVTLEDCGNTVEDNSTTTWAFSTYDVGSEETGVATETYTNDGNTTTTTYAYSVNDDATTLTLSILTTNVVFNINKLTGSDLEVSITNTVDNITDCTTFETEEVDVTTTAMFTKN